MPPQHQQFDRRERRRFKRTFDRIESYGRQDAKNNKQMEWRGDDGLDKQDVIANAQNEPVYEIYNQNNQYRKDKRRTRGDGLKEDFQQKQDAKKQQSKRSEMDADDEIEGKENETTKQVDALLMATKQLLTRRINFVNAKRKYTPAHHIPGLVPLNAEKTIFEYKVKKSGNDKQKSDDEDDNTKDDDEDDDDEKQQSTPDASPQDDNDREPPTKKQKLSTTASKSTGSGNKDVYVDEDRSFLDPPYQLYPIEKVIQNMGWKKVTKIGGGLVNLGNTCFMNAALQCLLYTPPLANYLNDRFQNLNNGNSNATVAKFNAIDELAKLLQKVTTGKTTSPDKIANNLRAIGKFRLGRQEDSHEFLLGILDRMETVILGQYEDKLDKRVAKTNIINQIFGGYYRSQVKSLQSNYVSNTYDLFVDLSVTIAQNSTLEKALARETTPESLDGDNKYKCPITRKYVKAVKRLSIHRAPPVLVISLKRFDIFGKKVGKHIQYPEKLDLSPFMSNPEQDANYNLYAVLVHSGGTCHSGHYYSFVKASNSIWYEMDDSRVSQVSAKTVLSQKAYILFYVREYPSGKAPPQTPLPKALKTPTSFAPLNPNNAFPIPAKNKQAEKDEDEDEDEMEVEEEEKKSAATPSKKQQNNKDNNSEEAEAGDSQPNDKFKITPELLAKASPNNKRKHSLGGNNQQQPQQQQSQQPKQQQESSVAQTPTKQAPAAQAEKSSSSKPSVSTAPSTPRGSKDANNFATPSKAVPSASSSSQQPSSALKTPKSVDKAFSQSTPTPTKSNGNKQQDVFNEPQTPVTPGRNCELSAAKLAKFKQQHSNGSASKYHNAGTVSTPLTPGKAAKLKMMSELEDAMKSSSSSSNGNNSLSLSIPQQEAADVVAAVPVEKQQDNESTPRKLENIKAFKGGPKSPKSPKVLVPPLAIVNEVQPENAAKLISEPKTPVQNKSQNKQQVEKASGFAKPETPKQQPRQANKGNSSEAVRTPVPSLLVPPREGTPIVQKVSFDPYRHLSSGSLLSNQFGEDVDKWDASAAEDQKKAIKSMAVDNLMKHAKSDWDKFIDSGKVKKIKQKNAEDDSEEWNNNAFQKVASRKFAKKN